MELRHSWLGYEMSSDPFPLLTGRLTNSGAGDTRRQNYPTGMVRMCFNKSECYVVWYICLVSTAIYSPIAALSVSIK